MPKTASLTREETVSIILTVVFGIGLGVLAWFSFYNNRLFWLSVSLGALGGLVHEIAQSHGRIMFLKKYQDGLYLGSIAGMVLGAVAGILAIQSYLITGAAGSPLAVSATQISYEVFFAGLALKGIVEAATSNPTSE